MVLIGMISSASLAQSVVEGRVVDQNLEPLTGANLIISGTTEGTFTDVDGYFKLVTERSFPVTLEFTYTGYLKKTIIL